MVPAVVLSRVSRIYPGHPPVTALRDVSLDLAAGARLAIMGPSGAGKSTLLNLVGGLDVPTSGSITVDGVDVASLDERGRSLLRRSTVAYVFQSYHLLPTLTCAANVAAPLDLQARPRAEVRERVTQALEDVGLAHRAHHLPAELSGGERQRIAIARAVVTRPRVLLVDEPTGNLDTGSRDQILALLDSLTGPRRAALLLVTHDARAASLCDERAELIDGVLGRPVA